VKPLTRPSVASAALSCAAGQHPWNGRCVDDDPLPEQPTPAPPPSCVEGTHLEDGACVVDASPTPTPSPYPQYNAGNGTGQPEPHEAPNPWRGVLAYLAIGTGISAAAFGIGALGAAGKAADGCNETTKTCTNEAAQSRQTATTMAVLADVSLGLTVLSVVGIFLLPSKVKVGAAPTPNGVSAAASWRF
jgi:hypothetical protein